MEVSHGGHLSHGHRIGDKNISETAHRFNSVPYHVDLATNLIDYDEVEKLAHQHRPRILVVGGSSYCRHIDFARLRNIADQVGALVHYDMSHFCGLVASGVFPSPFPYCDVVTTTSYKTLRGPQGALIIFRRWMEDAINTTVFPRFQCGPNYRSVAAMVVALKQARTEEYRREQQLYLDTAATLSRELLSKGHHLLTGGTDSHMMLVDLRKDGISGFEVESVLRQVNIIANQNPLPGNKGLRFSGLRLATTPMVIRGLQHSQGFVHVAELVHRGIELTKALSKEFKNSEAQQSRRTFLHFLGGSVQCKELRDDVTALARQYPLPSYLYQSLL
jgi:glycine hydroxymethyltransferase